MAEPSDDTRSQTPKAVRGFAREVGTVLPARLAALRRLGKQTRALSGHRPAPKR